MFKLYYEGEGLELRGNQYSLESRFDFGYCGERVTLHLDIEIRVDIHHPLAHTTLLELQEGIELVKVDLVT